MSEKIISKPATPEYEEAWDRVFNKRPWILDEKHCPDFIEDAFNEVFFGQSKKNVDKTATS